MTQNCVQPKSLWEEFNLNPDDRRSSFHFYLFSTKAQRAASSGLWEGLSHDDVMSCNFLMVSRVMS